MIKKGYLVVMSLAVVSILLGSLLYNSVIFGGKPTPQPTAQKDSVEITLLSLTSYLGYGIFIDYQRPATLPFAFDTKARFLNVTGLWITVVAYSSLNDIRFNITLNELTLRSSIAKSHGSYPSAR